MVSHWGVYFHSLPPEMSRLNPSIRFRLFFRDLPISDQWLQLWAAHKKSFDLALNPPESHLSGSRTVLHFPIFLFPFYDPSMNYSGGFS